MPKTIAFLLLCGATLILFTQTFASPSYGLQPAGFLPMIIQSSGSAVTPTATATATVTPSITPTPSNTPTITPPPTITSTSKATFTPSPSPSFTPTPTPTFTPTPTPTFTPTPTPTFTPTPAICPTQFEGTLTAGAVLVAITAEVGEILTVTDLITSQVIGTGTAQAENGHLCPGFALVSVTPLLTNHTIIVESSNNTFDVETVDCDFGPYPLNANGVTTIEAENFTCGGEGIAYHDDEEANLGGTYRLTEGVDIQTTSDTGGGFNVGWVRDGEWIKYKFYVASTNIYAINFRYATNSSNTRLQLFIDNVDIGAGVIQLPNTGGSQNWATYYTSNTFLNPGVHTLEVRFIRGPINFNYSQFMAGGFSTPTPIPTNTPTPTPTPTNTPPPTPTPNTSQGVFYSLDAEDGFIVELNATGNGDTINTSGIIEIGDTWGSNNTGRKQRKGILSFNTSALPDNAVITSVVLRVNRDAVNGDPTSLGPLQVDIAPNSGFNNSYSLEKQDFEAAPAGSLVATLPFPTTNGSWAETSLNSEGLNHINTTGKTQFRLYFALRTDGDGDNDKLLIKSGSSSSAKPELIVTYTIGHAPVAQFTSSVVSGTLPLEVALDNTSFDPDGTIANSEWDFGDGVTRTYTNTGPHTAHVFTQPGTFTITLTITDDTGLVDTAVLPITVLANPLYAGCPAQPIGVHVAERSLAPESYPDPGQFNYPENPPTYEDFLHNEPNVPFYEAQTGYIYKVFYGSNAGNFTWLKWNKYLFSNTSNLQDSLIWPGNNEDYLTAGANGQVPPGINPVTNEPFTHPVYGFINVVDDTDFVLQEGDWIATNTAVSSAAFSSLDIHIDQQSLLRLPIWQNSTGTGSSISIQMTQFAWFKLQGYRGTQGGDGGPWLLLEFVEFDEQCGQIIEP